MTNEELISYHKEVEAIHNVTSKLFSKDRPDICDRLGENCEKLFNKITSHDLTKLEPNQKTVVKITLTDLNGECNSLNNYKKYLTESYSKEMSKSQTVTKDKQLSLVPKNQGQKIKLTEDGSF